MDQRIIAKKLEILTQRMIVRRLPIEGWAVRQAVFEAVGSYTYHGDWRLMGAPASFPALRTVFFRADSTAPASTTPSGKVFMQFDFEGLEALLSVDGVPYAGLDTNHSRIPAPPAGEHVLEIEAMSLMRAYCQPELRDRQSTFRGAAWIEVDAEIEAAVYDLRLCADAVTVIRDPRRRERLAEALERALLQIDLTLPDQDLRQDVRRARDLLAGLVNDILPDPEGGRVYLAGHTHIDTAWLWPLKETVRKCGRTFSTAVRLLEQYPDFHFSCSQAQLYAYTKEHYPALYKEIKRWVAAGRWHTTGAMWVETDCNVPSGESLIRQVLYGLEFYREEFGTRPRTCWLPDVFGYPASLPQILSGCGIPYFFTCKLHWQSKNPFPNHLFWWEGVDGSRVLAHIPKLRNYYNGYPNPEQLTIAWENYIQKSVHGEVMLPFGYGDGGGGVTPEMLELVDRSSAYPGLPATRTGGEEVYFDQAAERGDKLPVWEGELYLETHRGTYTTQSHTKQANRASERLLREAELWASVAGSMGAPLLTHPLKSVWLDVLTQQFHDILPGSSIGEVYRDALADHDRAQQVAAELRTAALDWLIADARVGGDLCVFNSLSWPRSDPVEATIADPGGLFNLVDAQGRACPVQVLGRESGKARILFEPHAVPALGWASFGVHPAEPVELGPSAVGRVIESPFYRLELDEEGAIERLLDKRANREVIPAGERANIWQLFQDGPEREAAWNVHDTFEKRRYPISGAATISVVEI